MQIKLTTYKEDELTHRFQKIVVDYIELEDLRKICILDNERDKRLIDFESSCTIDELIASIAEDGGLCMFDFAYFDSLWEEVKFNSAVEKVCL